MDAERARFQSLQARFAETHAALFADPLKPRTVVVVPSLSFDEEILSKISGAHHYEERLLSLLLLLRMPRTQLLYLTSVPVPPAIVDYYLHLLPGVPAGHARARLHMLACEDAAARPLTAKLLDRPRLLARVRDAIRHPEAAHMSAFTVTTLERRLAVALDLPIYGCDPELLGWGTKSGSRRIFREAGVPLPAGHEDLRDMGDVAQALVAMKAADPALRRAVVKLDEGFSGEGNAVFDFAGAPEPGGTGSAGLAAWVRGRLPALACEAKDMGFDAYAAKFDAMGGIVEAWVEGAVKQSPSAQVRVDPGGHTQAISTHDQVLGGRSGQIFLGCRFPADPAYRLEIQAHGLAAGRALAAKGVTGRFGIDFVSVKDGDGWRHLAIEVNLRKGGTTHPFHMLQLLADGTYDPQTGDYRDPMGRPCYYRASDTIEQPAYRGLTAADLVDIAAVNGLHFHAATGEGVVFHLIGALSEFGKLGAVCIAGSAEGADALFDRTVATLDAAVGDGGVA